MKGEHTVPEICPCCFHAEKKKEDEEEERGFALALCVSA